MTYQFATRSRKQQEQKKMKPVIKYNQISGKDCNTVTIVMI